MDNHVEVSNIKWKLKHQFTPTVIRGSGMSEFSVSKDMDKYTIMVKGEFQDIL